MTSQVTALAPDIYEAIKAELCVACSLKIPDLRDSNMRLPGGGRWMHSIHDVNLQFECRATMFRNLRGG